MKYPILYSYRASSLPFNGTFTSSRTCLSTFENPFKCNVEVISSSIERPCTVGHANLVTSRYDTCNTDVTDDFNTIIKQ